MSDPSTIVARQYTNFRYPAPITDMAEAINNGYWEYSTPNLVWPLMWPEGVDLKKIRILIAGCGTNQAAYNAMMLPDTQITAIDLSRTSLEHSQYLKEKHNLKNLVLKQMNLLDVGNLKQNYDLIISTGVLHHLSNPDDGLCSLRDVLAPDGIMSIMLYGLYLRLGVYMLQKAFKILGCQDQTQDDVELVKQTITNLDPRHVLNRYINCADDLINDAGIVDTFLHSQDQAYTVPDVISFAEKNNLSFFDWVDRLDYSYTAIVHKYHPINNRLKKLNQIDQWTITELLTQSRGTHRFFLSHPERANKTTRINFEKDQWLHWIPSIRFGTKVLEKSNYYNKIPAKLKRDWHEFTIDTDLVELLDKIDGNKKISDILKETPYINQEKAKSLYRQMHEWGHLLFSLKPYYVGEQ